MNIKYIKTVASLFIISIFFLSCSPKTIGYGTIIWSPDETQFQTGQNVTIISESELADVYLISDGSDNDPFQIDRWRIIFFEELTQAEKFSKSVSEYTNIYARNLKDGLLIREEPDINSQRAYKMRKDQILKVFGRTEEIANIGQYEGYWYHVITEEGVSGYCFDHYLDIYDSSISPEEKINPAIHLLETAFTKIYHPSNFIDMISSSAINLKEFTPKVGLFPDMENKILKITTSSYTLNIPWDNPVLVDKRSFSIGEDDYIIHVLSDRKLQINYYYEDQQVITNYFVIENIEDILLSEIERRETLYNQLLEAGTNFSSNAYGNISMGIDGSFKWSNYDRLVPQIIPAGSEGTGKIRFNKFITDQLKEEYTGIISFNFKYGDRIIVINFLYTLENKKLKLTYVPENDIDKLSIVHKKSISPVVLAFSAD